MNKETIIKVQQNGDLAAKLRSLGLSRIVDSSRIRRILGLPIHGTPPLRPSLENRPASQTAPLLWQRLANLQAGSPSNLEDIRWQRSLASTEMEMGNLAASAIVWRRVQRMQDAGPQDWVGEADVLNRMGQPEAARQVMDSARSRVPTVGKLEGALLWGLGAHYQAHGDWDLAAAAYVDELSHRLESGNADSLAEVSELSYRAGLALDRCFRWEEAEEFYRFASYVAPTDGFRAYKLALSIERQFRWVEAANAYEHAVSISEEKQKPYRLYRVAYCLHKAGLFKRACQTHFGISEASDADGSGTTPDGIADHKRHLASTMTWSRESTATSWLAAAAYRRSASDKLGEAAALERAIDRTQSHSPALYEKLARVYFELGKYEISSTQLVRSRLFQRPDGIDLKPYQGASGVAAAAKYAEYRETLPVRPGVIVFESYHGAKANCHPLAIFEGLANKPFFKDMLIVWSLRRGEKVPSHLRGLDNVVIAERGSDLYLRYLATAERLITNVSLPEYFVRREGQYYLNTWHGTPVKSLGKDIRPGYLDHTNVTRNFLQATHLLSTCSWMTDVYLDRYDIRGLFTGEIAEVGSPRSDKALKSNDARRKALREQLGIESEDKVVLYAPTWRGLQGKPSSDIGLIEDALSALDPLQSLVLFRGHHFAEKALVNAGLANRLVPDDVDTNELLGIVDVLITDYSSIFFDFLAFDRPIVFYVPDEEAYRQERGLYFEASELPGIICRQETRLLSSVEEALAAFQLPATDGQAPIRHRWREQYAPKDDGRSTQRAIDFFFGHEKEDVVEVEDDRPLVLVRSALLPNGITTSVRNLMASIDPASVRLVNINDTPSLTDSRRREQLLMIPEHVGQIGRAGAPCYTPEERWVMTVFNRKQRFLSDAHRLIAQRAYAREFERLVGPAHFDAVVEFDGYAGFWVNLLAAAPRVSRRAVYQHNDLYAEWKTRFPELAAVFSEYLAYDEIVGISPSISELNLANLADEFAVPAERFTVAHNQINPREVRARALQSVDEDVLRWFESTTGHTFVTMGRLSVEKAHWLLLESFSRIADEVPSRLVVIGSGALAADLQRQAKKLGIADRVLFTGQRLNPMGILQKCDTFVMSSKHEGQPMVLGEAMMLGLPVISTDLPGTRDMLGGGLGTLVPHETEALAEAMRNAAQGNMNPQLFDTAEYMAMVLQEFSRVSGVKVVGRDISVPEMEHLSEVPSTR